MTSLLDWTRRQALRWPPLYEALRAIKHRLPARLVGRQRLGGGPLPDEAYRAGIAIVGPLPAFRVAETGMLTVEVANDSPRTWPAGEIAVSYRWRRTDGSLWSSDGGRTPLPEPLGPGGTVRVTCPVRPPNTPARYRLEMDLVHGSDAWFGERGSQTFRREVEVGGLQPDAQPEMDYEQIYRKVDLDKDFWSVSGPASAEEFRQLGRSKVEMLKALGLRADSRILDVGCGTGSVAEALLDFLGEGGLYYGTDLSEVAVDFCRKHYARPNFRFDKNGMTTVPIDGQEFDFIVFFSVFTHTYSPETRDLLAEAKRLLAPEGMVVADVFESDIEGESLGTRAMIVLPRGRMLEMADALGLEAHTISEFEWDPTGPRRIDRILRRFGDRSRRVSG